MKLTSFVCKGVNLPARRVLINGPYDFSGAFLPVATYRQMIGRAGRAGIDTLGEAMLFCRQKDFMKAMKNLVGAQLPPIESCLAKRERTIVNSTQSSSSQSNFMSASQVSQMSLSEAANSQQWTEKKSTCLKRAILEVVSNGTARSEDQVEEYVKSTFYSTSSQLLKRADEWLPTPFLTPDDATISSSCRSSHEEIKSAIKEASLDLMNEKLIHGGEEKENQEEESADSKKSLSVSILGKAIVASGIGPDEGQFIQRELNRARENMKLKNEQHIVYLVSSLYILCTLSIY